MRQILSDVIVHNKCATYDTDTRALLCARAIQVVTLLFFTFLCELNTNTFATMAHLENRYIKYFLKISISWTYLKYITFYKLVFHENNIKINKKIIQFQIQQ